MRFLLKTIILIFILTSYVVSSEAGVGGADKAFFAGDYDKALKKYNSCIDDEKTGCHCSFMTGKTLFNRKEYPEAVSYLKKAIDMSRNGKCDIIVSRSAWYFWLGRAYYENVQYKEAIDSFAKAVTIAAKDPGSLMPEYATVWRKTYLNLIPPKSGCYFWLGTAYYMNGQYKDAVTSLEQAIKLEPDAIDFYTTLAGAYKQLEQYDNAITAVKKSIEIKPSTFAYGVLATIYKVKGQYDDAIDAYKKHFRSIPMILKNT